VNISKILKYCLITHECVITYDKYGFRSAFKKKEYYELFDLFWVVALASLPFLIAYLLLF
jgi:hypothetical protein